MPRRKGLPRRCMLCLGGPESAKTLARVCLGEGPSPRRSSTPKHGLLRLGVGVSSRTEMASFLPFSSEFFQPKHTLFETKP